MAAYTQERRSLAVTSDLGPDAFLLLGFNGTEAISNLFTYQLELASEQDGISPNDVVGKGLTWCVRQVDADPRYFHGLVNRYAAGPRGERGLFSYRAEVVPWLWFLTRTTDCRIFQDMTSLDIIKAVFDELGFSDYDVADCKGPFAKREYCVQYRETAFNFVSRLMEQDGIFYYFKHEEGKHKLVMADAKSAYFDCAEAEVNYSRGSLAPNHVYSWEHRYEFRSGKWTRTDYNFITPSTSLLTSTPTVLEQPGLDKYELFDYPGDYYVKGDGDPVTKIRMEEDEAAYDIVHGASRNCTFTPGGVFELKNHEVPSEKGRYLITAVQHEASEASYGASGGGGDYSNQFRSIPAAVIFRPERVTPRAVVRGPQTAVVTGPGGEEIFVDKYGRVKVQFFWDRRGKKDDKSSCWIRVSENWAGKNWGLVAHPRMGQEVVVDFLEGDPDRPLITGRVYNAEQMPPYDVPANKTQTGIKTRSSKGGGTANFNEIRFEDLKGEEQLFIHAEKNQDIEVENDETHWVGHDRKKTIDNDETTLVKRDRTETVDRDEKITIHANRTEEVDKEEKITIHGGRTEEVDKDESITIHQNRTEEVDKNESITIHGSRTEQVDKDESITIDGGRTEKVAKDETVGIDGNRSHTIGKNDTLDVGKVLTITAGDQISITTGQASIVMKKNGDITITGKNITITGSGEIVGKATKNMTLKGKKILQN